jgi:hypothetical protein
MTALSDLTGSRNHPRWHRHLSIFFLVLVVALASPALLTAEEMLSPLLDRYTFTLGSYFTEVDSDVSADSPEGGIGDRLDFESDLAFGNSDELFRFEGQFILKKRHQLNVAFYDLNRRATNTITREIEWRDWVFPVNSEVEGFFDTQVVELSYTYWLVAKEKVVFGLNAGITMLGIDIGVDLAERTAGSLSADIGLDEPVPLIGFEVRAGLTRRLYFRGLGRAVTVSDIGDLSRITVSDFSVGLEHRTFGKGGFGIAYKALNFDIEIEKDLPLNRVLTGEVDYGFGGLEVYLRFWFK